LQFLVVAALRAIFKVARALFEAAAIISAIEIAPVESAPLIAASDIIGSIVTVAAAVKISAASFVSRSRIITSGSAIIAALFAIGRAFGATVVFRFVIARLAIVGLFVSFAARSSARIFVTGMFVTRFFILFSSI